MRPANQSYLAYVERLRKQHGDKFSDASLSQKFASEFGDRIEVRFSDGTIKRGWVTGTTGWQPSLMILLRRNSSGSSWLLSDKDCPLQTLERGPRR